MLNEFLLLAMAHLFAVASPGADFALVLKNTLQGGRQIGIATAIGIGGGILVHVGYTLLGVSLILAQSETLFSIVKFAGAFYLLWLAYKSFQSRRRTSESINQQKDLKISQLEAMKQGFVVNVLNPKVTVFFVALFANIVSPTTPLAIQIGYGFWLSIYTILWFTFVAWSFSRKFVLVWYQSNGHFIDWAMGLILILIAIRLIT